LPSSNLAFEAHWIVIVAIIVVGSFNLAIGFVVAVAIDHPRIRDLWGAEPKTFDPFVAPPPGEV